MFYKNELNPIFEAHPEIARFVPHQLRHTTATLLKTLGIPAEVARDILQHASIATTVQVYQDEVAELQQDALSKLCKLLGRNAARSPLSISRSRRARRYRAGKPQT